MTRDLVLVGAAALVAYLLLKKEPRREVVTVTIPGVHVIPEKDAWEAKVRPTGNYEVEVDGVYYTVTPFQDVVSKKPIESVSGDWYLIPHIEED